MGAQVEPVPTITVRHTKMDLARLGFYATSRSPALQWTLFALSVVIVGINLKQRGAPLNLVALISILLTTAIFVSAAYVFILALSTLATVLQNGKRSPAAETHAYRLSEDGLVRASASSESLLKWGGARSLHKSKAAIYVGSSSSAYFLLPRHSFGTDEEYASFWNAIQRLAPQARGAD